MACVYNKVGQTLVEKEHIKNRWADYYRELYREQNPVDDTILRELPVTNAAEHMEDFIKEEVEAPIEWLKWGAIYQE